MKKIFSSSLLFLFSILLVSCGSLHKVTFDTDGANLIKTQEVKNNELVVKPADPIKNGYDFKIWIDLDTELEYDFNNKVTKDINLKAVYDVKEDTTSVVVKFDFNFDNKLEEVKIAKGDVVSVPEVKRAGFKIIHWINNGIVFNVDNKITENITLVAVWSELTVKDLTLEYLNSVNYSSLLSKGFELDLEVELSDFVTPYDPEVPSSVLGMKINDIKANLNFKFNPLTSILFANVLVHFESIDFISHSEGEVTVLDEEWFVDVTINQQIALYNNKLYSSFEGKMGIIKEKDEEENDIIEYLKLADAIGNLGMFIPAEYQPFLEMFEDLYQDYSEYIDLEFDNALMIEIINQVSPFLSLLNSIPEELIKYSPFDFLLEGNVLVIENSLLQPFKITMEKEHNDELKSLKLESNIEGIKITSNLTTNPNIVLPDFTNFEKVDNLRLEQILAFIS